ncbi:MAG: DUF92 domain-containing protein [DPANN group archaeon]|nr:DUF92 domain-containing protein [DPANN group archaeon]
MIELLLPIALAGIILKVRALDLSGAIGVIILSYLVIVPQNVTWLYPILFSFLIITIATKIRYRGQERHEVRTIENVLANGGVAVAMAFFGHFYGFLGALSTATADSISSEVGKLGKEKPRMITDLRKFVQKGTNGGVTFFGTTVGLIAAGLIGIMATIILNEPKTIIIAALAGTLGNLADSWFGAVFENKRYLDNAGTNFLATSAGSLAGIILGSFL